MSPLLKQAIAESFTDRTLPPGVRRGRRGRHLPRSGSALAVPDLKVTVEKIIVAGDYVTVHMSFNGHFNWLLRPDAGQGAAIAFIATDLLKVEDGRITDTGTSKTI